MWRGMPRLRARLLKVPKAIKPSGTLLPTRAAPAAPWVPSPPAAIRRSGGEVRGQGVAHVQRHRPSQLGDGDVALDAGFAQAAADMRQRVAAELRHRHRLDDQPRPAAGRARRDHGRHSTTAFRPADSSRRQPPGRCALSAAWADVRAPSPPLELLEAETLPLGNGSGVGVQGTARRLAH